MPGSITPLFEDLCLVRLWTFCARGKQDLNPVKVRNEDIITIYFIDISYFVNLRELFLSQVLIYAIMYYLPARPSLGPMTFGAPVPYTDINSATYKRAVVE